MFAAEAPEVCKKHVDAWNKLTYFERKGVKGTDLKHKNKAAGCAALVEPKQDNSHVNDELCRMGHPGCVKAKTAAPAPRKKAVEK